MFFPLTQSAFSKEITFIALIVIFFLFVNGNKTPNVLREKSRLITSTTTYYNNLKFSTTYILTNNSSLNGKNINQNKETELIERKQRFKGTTIWPDISSGQYLQFNITDSKTSLFKNSSNFNNKIQVVSFCNGPGRPPKSQLTPNQLIYLGNEQVSYSCDNFISLKQYRKCIKGKWTGDFPLCGTFFI